MLAVFVATGISGCSLMFVQSPETVSPRSNCTTSQLAPVLDGQAAINASFVALGGLAGAASDVNLYGAMEPRGYLGVTAGAAVVAGIATHSANKGFQRVRWCSEVRYGGDGPETRSDRRGRRPARSGPATLHASPSDESAAPEGERAEDRNRDQPEERETDRSDGGGGTEPPAGDTGETEAEEADEPDSRGATQPDSTSSPRQDQEVNCDDTGSKICSDDIDCLGDDVCDSDQNRCVPAECVGAEKP